MKRVASLWIITGLLFLPVLISAHAQQPNSVITEQTTFIDSLGRENLVGTVKNTGSSPSEVYLDVNATNGILSKVIENSTYGRTVWPQTESPFKITLPPGEKFHGQAYVGDMKNIDVSQYNLLVLNYSNMGLGTEKALVGTVKNIGPFDFDNVSIFASVHNSNGTQIDTVRSNIIPVLHSGETHQFSAAPDPSIKNEVLYYSCAGLDANAPITTVDIGGGKFIAFQLQAIAKIADFRYENATNSINLVVTPYGLNGGPFTIKLPENSQNQRIIVSIDNQTDQNAKFDADGKTLTVNVFIPKGDHNISIQGIRTIPEIGNMSIMLIASFSIVLILLYVRGNRTWQAG